jgi:hypothetical protein
MPVAKLTGVTQIALGIVRTSPCLPREIVRAHARIIVNIHEFEAVPGDQR